MATDRRTKYTKSVIRQALFDLLKEKPLNKITVTDICKMADINRSTFYSYYEDVYALLTQIQNELFENIVLTLANDNWFNDILHLIDQKRDLCQVLIGPHGDSSFIPWSCAEVSGAKLDDYVELMHALPVDKDAMAEYVHKSGGEIIKNKGATFYAVTVSVCRLCSMLLSAYNSIVTVSTMMHGEYGLEDVCISTLAIVGPNGVQGKLPVRLTEDEMQKLHASADKLKETIGQIYFEA